MKRAILITLALFALAAANDVFAGGLRLRLGPEELVQTAGVDIAVLGYSVPSFVDWDNDGDNDLVIGEGPSSSAGKVRVYLNTGTASNPQFSGFTYVQSSGSDLTCPVLGRDVWAVFPASSIGMAIPTRTSSSARPMGRSRSF